MVSVTEGWLFDLQSATDHMVLWIYTQKGDLLRLIDRFHPLFYVAGRNSALDHLSHSFQQQGILAAVTQTERREFWSGKLIQVSAWAVRQYAALPSLVRQLVHLGCERLYQCDIPLAQYYLSVKQLFPLCQLQVAHLSGQVLEFAVQDSPWDVHYRLPDLRIMHLRLSQHRYQPLDRGNTLVLEGDGQTLELLPSSSSELIRLVNRFIERLDPDLILSVHGDTVIIPTLLTLAAQAKIPLLLDRERHTARYRIVTEGRSYFSYGQVVYKGPTYPLTGRWHIDQQHPFLFTETGLEGLGELARLSKIPIQRLARTSPGSAMSAMKLDQAMREGWLIPWRKSEPEAFKSAWDLLVADKGGLVYQPPIGAFEQVAEIDFSQMYPTIMVEHNISPETVGCSCCTSPAVPEVGYTICAQREGLIPRTLRPILAKRKTYKHLLKEAMGHDRARYHARQSAIKWCLVSCFGYLGYKNARFGRIEAHEAVTAFGREKLLQAKEMAEAAGYEVLHALTDSLWIRRAQPHRPGTPLCEDHLRALCQQITAVTQVDMDVEGIYTWCVFLPSKSHPDRPVPGRFFGRFQHGELKVRGLLCRREDMPPLIREAQRHMLQILAQAPSLAACATHAGEILECFQEYARLLQRGKVALEHLLITRRLSRNPEDYQGNTQAAIAAQQLQTAGVTLHAGESVRYVLLKKGSKRELSRQVCPEPLLTPDLDYDVSAYMDLLEEATTEVLGVMRGDSSLKVQFPFLR